MPVITIKSTVSKENLEQLQVLADSGLSK